MASVMPPSPRRPANTAAGAIVSVPARLAGPFPAPVRQASPSGTVSRTRWSGSPRPSDRGRGRKLPRGGGLRAGRRCGVEGPGARSPRVARRDALPPAPHARDPADPGPGDRSGTGGRDTGPALSGPAVRPVDIPVALPVRFPVDAAGGGVGFRRAGPAGEHTGRVPSFGARARGGAHRVQGTGCDGPAADVAPFRQTVHRGRFPATGAVAGHPHRRRGRAPPPAPRSRGRSVPPSRVSRAVPVGGPDAPAVRRGRPRDPSPGSRPSPKHIPGAPGSTAANALWTVDLACGAAAPHVGERGRDGHRGRAGDRVPAPPPPPPVLDARRFGVERAHRRGVARRPVGIRRRLHIRRQGGGAREKAAGVAAQGPPGIRFGFPCGSV